MVESPLGEAVSSTETTDKCSSVGCPVCGKVYKNAHGMRIHHALVHGESLSKKEKECEECGDSFISEPSGGSKFCSKECHQTNESRKHEKKRPTVICEGCGCGFEVKPYREETARFCSSECRKVRVVLECEACERDYEVRKHRKGDSRFCSIKCQWRHIGSQQEKQGNELECDYCGGGYYVKPSHEDGSKYCSWECKCNYQSENYVGENATRWKGGYNPYYGEDWLTQRRKAIVRDHCQCQHCGDTPLDLGREPDVHHITRLGWYKEKYDAPEWWEKGNDLDNLVTLCHEHHKLWEGIPLRPTLL